MDYTILLSFYLTSDEWDVEKDMFFDIFLHNYDLHEADLMPPTKKEYLISEIYLHYLRKDVDDGGYPIHEITQTQFERFFDKRYSINQRFAIIFGFWWGLSDKQLRRIGDLRYRKYCLDWLNYFLCEPNASLDISLSEVKEYRYTGRYFLLDPDTKILVPVKQITPQGEIICEHTEKTLSMNDFNDRSRSYEDIIGQL